MLAPFAALEARLNTAVLGRLSNAVVTVAGVEVAVIFDRTPAVGGVGPLGMVTTSPEVSIATASVPADPVGQVLVMGTEQFSIAAHEPDGTGMSRLLLEPIA